MIENELVSTNKSMHVVNPNQGTLFNTKRIFVGSDPDTTESYEVYSGEPSLPEKITASSLQLQSLIEHEEQDDNSEEQNLFRLKAIVRMISAANQRGGFVKSPEGVIVESAYNRRLTPEKALKQASDNALRFIINAEIEYSLLQQDIQRKLGSAALAGANIQGAEAIDFLEFVPRVSGPENRNLRNRIRRAKSWKDSFTALLSRELSSSNETPDNEDRAGQSDYESTEQPAHLEPREEMVRETPYLRYYILLSKFVADLYSKSHNKDTEEPFESLWQELATSDHFSYPRGVLMSTKDLHTFVRAPDAYKRSIRRPESRRSQQDYNSIIADKVSLLVKRRDALNVELDSLGTVELIIDGRIGKTDQYPDLANKLADAHKILNTQIDILAEWKNWGAEETGVFKMEQDELLLRGKLPDGTSVSVSSAWKEAISASRTRIQAQKDLFDWNISELSK